MFQMQILTHLWQHALLSLNRLQCVLVHRCSDNNARHWKSISTHQMTTQKFTCPKYGHCDANGESFQIFGDAALLSKKDNRRPSGVSPRWRNWHKSRKGGNVLELPLLKPFTWSPYYLLQTVYCSLCKRGNGVLKRSKSCYFVIVGSSTPQKKIFRKCVSVKAVKDYVVTFCFFLFFLKEVTCLSCVENCLCYETVLISFQVNTLQNPTTYIFNAHYRTIRHGCKHIYTL